MTTDGGGWIVMQRRFDGSVSFYRDWNNYKDGFGDVYGEHWIGNEFVHQYTNAFSTEMIAEATAFNGERVSAKMLNLKLSDEASKYVLEYDICVPLAGTKDGCSKWNHSSPSSPASQNFTTFDSDNDRSAEKNCAVKYYGGWWYKACFGVNLNGNYSNVPALPKISSGIHWAGFRTHMTSLKETKMFIRRMT